MWYTTEQEIIMLIWVVLLSAYKIGEAIYWHIDTVKSIREKKKNEIFVPNRLTKADVLRCMQLARAEVGLEPLEPAKVSAYSDPATLISASAATDPVAELEAIHDRHRSEIDKLKVIQGDLMSSIRTNAGAPAMLMKGELVLPVARFQSWDDPPDNLQEVLHSNSKWVKHV